MSVMDRPPPEGARVNVFGDLDELGEYLVWAVVDDGTTEYVTLELHHTLTGKDHTVERLKADAPEEGWASRADE